MTVTLPMFPLNAVVFPGASLPLRVFEERYLALVEHLLQVPDPTARVFGTVAIREGYEVGERGAQSVYKVGCRVRLTEVEPHADGTFDVVGVGLERLELERLDTGGPFPVGHVSVRPEPAGPVPDDVVERARATFVAHRAALSEIAVVPPPARLPSDPAYLAWVLAAGAPLPLPDRQAVLEADDPTERLIVVTDLLQAELRAMNVIPSLPATEVARTRWSPN